MNKVDKYWRERKREGYDSFLKDLQEYLGVFLDDVLYDDLLLTWGNLRELDVSCVSIGAQSINHCCFGDGNFAKYKEEVLESKNRLEKELGHPITFFAYPYGVSGSYNKNVEVDIVSLGFKYAFTLGENNGSQFDPFRIGRRCVNSGIFSSPSGSFCKCLLALELSGLGDILFRKLFGKRIDPSKGPYQ
ncbi:MAG: polysaccharide deacetylase family protein [Tissierellales bacterium]|nr:polysaccharide deacetylase family protein [Tissierellales bacterium]